MNYSDIDKMLDKVNANHYKIRYDEALTKSVERRARLDARTIQIQKRRRNIKIGAIAAVTAVAIAAGVPIAKRQYMINKAIDYQKQEISMMTSVGLKEFGEDQMLGLMELFGDEKGIEMVTGENWQDYCWRNGYTEIINVSENGTYATRTPSIKVLKNYLEAKAVEKMKKNTDDNGEFVFPSIENNLANSENVNDGGKTI